MRGIGAYQAKIDWCVSGLFYIKANGYEYAEDQRSGSEKIRGDGTMLSQTCYVNATDINYAGSVSASLKTMRPMDQEFIFNRRC